MPKFNIQYLKNIILLLFFISYNAFSQQKTTKHKIQKGETITSIAKDYNVKANEIYDLNPNAKKVLKLNSVLLIPILKDKKEKQEKRSSKKTEILTEKTHEVLPKETLYGISKQYKISVSDLKKWNPILENGNLEIGQNIFVSEHISEKQIEVEKEEKIEVEEKEVKIITSKPTKKQLSKEPETEIIVHEVIAKETKYALAKKFKTTIQELEKQNPEIIKSLPVGFKLNIRVPKTDGNFANTETEKPNSKNIQKSESDVVVNKDTISLVKHVYNSDLATKLVQKASENVGARYRSGGTSPGGFDCSGLMIYTFDNSGIKLPRTSNEQSRFGTKIDKSDAQNGDLIFFSTNGSGRVNHVGMVVENADGEIKFIHSSIHSGVIISSTLETYYKKNFVQINRVVE